MIVSSDGQGACLIESSLAVLDGVAPQRRLVFGSGLPARAGTPNEVLARADARKLLAERLQVAQHVRRSKCLTSEPVEVHRAAMPELQSQACASRQVRLPFLRRLR